MVGCQQAVDHNSSSHTGLFLYYFCMSTVKRKNESGLVLINVTKYLINTRCRTFTFECKSVTMEVMKTNLCERSFKACMHLFEKAREFLIAVATKPFF